MCHDCRESDGDHTGLKEAEVCDKLAVLNTIFVFKSEKVEGEFEIKMERRHKNKTRTALTRCNRVDPRDVGGAVPWLQGG